MSAPTQFLLLSAGKSGASASLSAGQLNRFAAAWPCFGNVRPSQRLFASWDSSGDLVDVQGDDGLSGEGVAALLDDVQRAILLAVPAWQAAGHRVRLGAAIGEGVAA
jgi:hypothetical protein